MKNIVTCTKLTRLLLNSPCLVDLIDKLTGIGSGFAIPGNYYLYIKYKIRCGLYWGVLVTQELTHIRSPGGAQSG
jgi:hypothetical protein